VLVDHGLETFARWAISSMVVPSKTFSANSALASLDELLAAFAAVIRARGARASFSGAATAVSLTVARRAPGHRAGNAST
jgi:hypothetical protein